MKAEHIPFIIIPIALVVSGLLAAILKISFTIIVFTLTLSVELFYIIFDRRPDGGFADGGKTAQEFLPGTLLIFTGVFVAQLLIKIFLV